MPVVLREVGGAVQGGEPARVALVHRLGAVPDDVVQHVDLLVRRGEVHGPARAVVLRPGAYTRPLLSST